MVDKSRASSSAPRTPGVESLPHLSTDKAGSGIMPSAKGSCTNPPIRASPRKSSASGNANPPAAPPQSHLPTPLSLSPASSFPSSLLPTSTSTVLLPTNTNTNVNTRRLPPAFSPPTLPSLPRPPPSLTPSRYSSGYTPSYSPYRPGEYGRTERGLANERSTTTRGVERRLFGSEEGGNNEDADELKVPSRVRGKVGGAGDEGAGNRGSSPLAPAFEAKMVLRNGASVDLISWLRTNFTHTPPSTHTAMTPSLSLIGIRALLLERFPRVPELDELSRAVTAAFPHSRWDYPTGPFRGAEPPTVRGLFWCGKDVAEEDDEDEEARVKEAVRARERERDPAPNVVTRSSARSGKIRAGYPNGGGGAVSRSPTQSTLVSPTSTNNRRHLPNTPARSVLEEFAEIATLAEKTPMSKARSLPGDAAGEPQGSDEEMEVDRDSDGAMRVPAQAYALANICNSFDSRLQGKKRRASDSPRMMGGEGEDKLHGLLAAAEAVEGSPITSLLSNGGGGERERGHKRRRTIGGMATMRDFGYPAAGHSRHRSIQQHSSSRTMLSSRGTASPYLGGTLPEHVEESVDLLVPLNDTFSTQGDEDQDPDTASTFAAPAPKRGHTASSASQSSSIVSAQVQPLSSTTDSNAAPPPQYSAAQRKPNELPTIGDHPGVDCKPPYPYHEMIRHAIETSQEGRLQLSQIYSSIADRFPFFKTLDERKTAGWQNSIRHNLSLKKMFVRVNKVDGAPEDTTGKGGWWTVQPGVPDEGRPGRKAKAKSRGSGASETDGAGSGGGGGGGGDVKAEPYSEHHHKSAAGSVPMLLGESDRDGELFTDKELRLEDRSPGMDESGAAVRAEVEVGR